MNNLADAGQKLAALVELLRIGGFDLTARINQPPPSEGSPRPELVVELRGADTPLLTARNGELLFAIEHIAAKLLSLEPEEHDHISFNSGDFKARRERELQRLATPAMPSSRYARRRRRTSSRP